MNKRFPVYLRLNPDIKHPLLFAPEGELSVDDIGGGPKSPAMAPTTVTASSSHSTTTIPSVTTTTVNTITSVVTSVYTNVTEYTNSTGVTGPAIAASENDHTGTVVAIVATIVLLIVLIALAYWYLGKSGKLRSTFGFTPIRRNRSSTCDSRRTLEEPVPDNIIMTSETFKPHQEADDDAFTIEDQDDDVIHHGGGGEEYYYDEVFGQSPFGDERTNTSVRELYNTHHEDEEEEEILDYDFETLGINIGAYKYDDTQQLNLKI